ncbi:rhodanese-like domain-containing protein [Flavobacterium sp. MFBS3-15]|uniref:rhodanese-like domain-containing protein n=1 Tax=Flavobacterium sp. MFBS3-15 TaxID=2989816 RepID=UPI0022360CFC|nr:rhodanese-like domain-containing protein [Flavobacterium sp. MFBS3-15]MCW4468896.1 rhodanese-like domain-containing protein [Flavobacterium sp. MFBS3-15]
MKKVFLLILCPFLFLSCKGQESDKIKKITAEELGTALKDTVQLIDVRTPAEFKQGHIEGAMNIDVNSADFEKNIQWLDKDKPVYIYCRSGQRSYTAAKRMEKAGFKVLYDVKGGILSWNGYLLSNQR